MRDEDGLSGMGDERPVANQSDAISWLNSSPMPAEASADAVASFNRGEPPGRAKNQSVQIARPNSGALSDPKCCTVSSSGSWRPIGLFRKWKSDQSRPPMVPARS